MPRYFLDSSAWAKSLHREAGSEVVDSLLADAAIECITSRLAATEMLSLFASKFRAGQVNEIAFNAMRSGLANDIASGTVRLCVIEEEQFQEADRLLTSVARVIGLRSLDALHLATARLIHLRTPVDVIVSADRRLLTAARAMGFATLDPENPSET